MKIRLNPAPNSRGFCKNCRQWVVIAAGILTPHSNIAGDTCTGSYTEPSATSTITVGNIEISVEESN